MSKAKDVVGLAVLIVACAFAPGCGSGSGLKEGDAAVDIQPFLGTWSATSGTITLTCAGQPMTTQVTDSTTWMAGTTSDLVQPPDSSGCSLLANVSGDTAATVPGLTCTQQEGGATVAITLTTYTFVVASDGHTASEHASGIAVVTGATTVTCTYVEAATYSKAMP